MRARGERGGEVLQYVRRLLCVDDAQLLHRLVSSANRFFLQLGNVILFHDTQKFFDYLVSMLQTLEAEPVPLQEIPEFPCTQNDGKCVSERQSG